MKESLRFSPTPKMNALHQQVLTESIEYLQLYHNENGKVAELQQRVAEVQEEIHHTGTYKHTMDELTYGAKVAWRNNLACIGKFYWERLKVRDMRHLLTAEQVFEALVEHLRLATNSGKIQLLLTVFAPQTPGEPGIRIWNSQLIHYAGYRHANGTIIGDPANADLTTAIRALGWKGRGEEGRFDVLPLVIQMPKQPPRLFELPTDAILEVPISHPEYPWFSELGLRWYAHPAISNNRLEIGGISYTAAPFSGWYTSAEIGARNLSDVHRYNILPEIAHDMGLNTRSDRTLWKDRALLELNVAVIYSFTTSKVSIIDHHYAAREFVRHEEREAQAGRSTPGLWRTLISPLSASTTPVYHRSYDPVVRKPGFFKQPDPWNDVNAAEKCFHLQ